MTPYPEIYRHFPQNTKSERKTKNRVLLVVLSLSLCKASTKKKKRLQPAKEPSLNLPFPGKFKLILLDRNETGL